MKIITKDHTIDIDKETFDKLLCCSEYVRVLYESSADLEIPINSIESKYLGLVIKYCMYHAPDSNDKKLEEDSPISCEKITSDVYDLVPTWYADFVTSLTVDEVFVLMNVANFMMITTLIELCCIYIATLLKDKTAEEIRRQFRIEDDFSEEERLNISKEHQWVKDLF